MLKIIPRCLRCIVAVFVIANRFILKVMSPITSRKN